MPVRLHLLILNLLHKIVFNGEINGSTFNDQNVKKTSLMTVDGNQSACFQHMVGITKNFFLNVV